ncbi:MAG: redoxin domain-containing protein [Actinomycetota bacterium]|nr:redoxin domain-containing protein [Actinomycetota bacterium]
MREADPGTAELDPLPEGTVAPDFTMPSSVGDPISLRDLRGKPVILAFYPADWSPTCSDQMSLYQGLAPQFERFDAHLLGISVDGRWCHQAFAKDRGIEFPLLADFEPKGAVATAYGVYRTTGVSKRALFVIDADGVIQWSHVFDKGVIPGADGIIEALEGMEQS